MELLRLLVAIPRRWEADFTNAFGGMLRPEELFSLPAYRDKVVWVGSDATPGVFGATDFTNAVYSREEIVVERWNLWGTFDARLN